MSLHISGAKEVSVDAFFAKVSPHSLPYTMLAFDMVNDRCDPRFANRHGDGNAQAETLSWISVFTLIEL